LIAPNFRLHGAATTIGAEQKFSVYANRPTALTDGTDEHCKRTAVRDISPAGRLDSMNSRIFRGTCLAKSCCMGTRVSNDKPQRLPHVDQEKSTDDIFEHVIRGVRLSRLRELLRGEHDQRRQEPDGWVHRIEPSTA
jgi:hypothetical protein